MTELTIDQERDVLLPKIERDQRELEAAVGELRTASADFGKRAAAWITVGLLARSCRTFVGPPALRPRALRGWPH
jgi:hypothetical protein